MPETASVNEHIGKPAGESASEYLVHMENRLPADFPPAEKARLMREESARARQLGSEGILVRLWRITGRRANVGIWHAASPDELHEALESLPLFPYLDIRVIPLSKHPNDPAGAAAMVTTDDTIVRGDNRE